MQNYKKIVLTLLMISIVGFAVSLIFGFSEKMGICQFNNRVCLNNSNNIAEPLLIISIPFIAILSILFLLAEIYFVTWRKFAIIFLPIATILTAITPSRGNNYISDIDRGKMVSLMSGLFFVISLLIIIYQKFFKKVK